MTAPHNSTLLEAIIQYARTVGAKPSAPFTAERYIAALLDILDGRAPLELGDSLVPVREAMDKRFPDRSAAREKLLQYINDDSHASFLDSLYILHRQNETAAAVRTEERDEIRPENLLACILATPSDCIKSVVMTSSFDTAVSKHEEPTADERDREFDKLYSELVTETPVSAKQKIRELTEKVKAVRQKLSETIFGQDNAIGVFTSGYFRGELLAMTDKTRVRPRATFLFAGPPGVGKTMLAMTAAKALGLPFERFDMSEYSDHYSAHEFIGSDGTFQNAKAGNFTAFVCKNPRSVILLDEIEKAHISIIHLFLQILDAGRIRDSNSDREISLADTVLIFTTNAGRQFYEGSELSDFSSVPRKVILGELQKDINPMTGQPYFPAAICSRFASGNVVMFNHIGAHSLRRIAKKEILRHAENFEREFGIGVEFDERVFTSLLFAEGGMADARAVRSRAEAFFDNELYELFRLASSERSDGDIGDIERIKLVVELPDGKPEIVSLFENTAGDDRVLVFADSEIVSTCEKLSGGTVIGAHSTETAAKLLRENDIKAILIDINCGRRGDADYLNIEDVESEARDFYRYLREYSTLPVYLLETSERTYDAEELLSFLRQGVRGVVPLTSEREDFAARLDGICAKLRQQESMEMLARSNKVVTFETAQRLTENGTVAEIKLFDFKLNMALDSDGRKSVMNNVSRPDVKLSDVIGAEDAKRELKYFIEYLKNPKKYRGTGVAAPRGVLLWGPPGTGKTMLAKAVASEAGVTFIATEGNRFLKKYVGEGPESVHELFRTARKYAPSIVFIDEIDAVAKPRTGSEHTGASEEILTALLTEMDGFNVDAARPVFVLAATNFSVEPGDKASLDSALMRRFDRRVYIDLPNRDERKRYMKMKLAGNKAFDISGALLESLAVRGAGMSLASLASVFELALRSAIRCGSVKVTDEVLEEAFETFNGGDKTCLGTSLLERVARHEAGHAFVCWHSGETPSYLTVAAREGHGGYMQHGDNEDRLIATKDELLSRIRTALGGRAAELVYYGERGGASTGASGDLHSATRIAESIICTYGMDDSFGLAVADTESARTGELAAEVRTAVNGILSSELQKAVRLISDNRDAVGALVAALINREHLLGHEVDEILTGAGAVRGRGGNYDG